MSAKVVHSGWGVVTLLSLLLMASMSIASASNANVAPLTPELSWTTCTHCSVLPEVSVSGNTIRMGVANRAESDHQARSFHGATAMLPAAEKYTITFEYDLYSWDAYFTPIELGRGYWDSFTVSVGPKPLWDTTLSDPITLDNLPGLGFIWGGAKWGDHILKHVSGTMTVNVTGSPSNDNFLSVALDTSTAPNSDPLYPSWGTINITTVDTGDNLSYLGEQAAQNARLVVGGDYLWGGKGWNWKEPKHYVSAQAILTDGYYYYKAADKQIVQGKGLDCSGLVYWAYDRASGATEYLGSPIWAEGAQEQFSSNTTRVARKEDLRPGDLLFFGSDTSHITHVAMYVGGNDPAENVVEAANPSVGIKYSNLDARIGASNFQGYGRVQLEDPALVIQTHSPVSLVVTDPNGITIDSATFIVTDQEVVRGIPGVMYYTTDQHGDDIVYSPELKHGVYTIKVKPKPGASPNETYGLEVIGAAKLIDLAHDTPISEIPPQGYQISVSDSEINPAAKHSYLPITAHIPYIRPALPLLNGNFESGPVNWAEVSSHGWPIILSNGDVDGLPTHSGSWSAWLGGEDDEISYVEQTVTVPADRPFLTYYHAIGSDDYCGYDFGGVIVNNTVVDQYDLCANTQTSGWAFHAVDLSAYAGQDVALQIRVETDDSINSNLFVDDVVFSGSGAVRLGERPVPFTWTMSRAALPLPRGAAQAMPRLLGPAH